MCDVVQLTQEMVDRATAEPLGAPQVRAAHLVHGRTLLIGSPEDAAAAFGEGSEWHCWAKSWFASQRGNPGPIDIISSPGADALGKPAAPASEDKRPPPE